MKRNTDQPSSKDSCAYNRFQRMRTIDRSVGRHGKEKTARVDLGLALLSLVARPGVPLSQDDIACWCGCSRAAIFQLEKRAMRRFRNAVKFGHAHALGKELGA